MRLPLLRVANPKECKVNDKVKGESLQCKVLGESGLEECVKGVYVIEISG
jgi:hypothetical protein